MADSKSIDALHQEAVDSLARQALTYSQEKILGLPDDETFSVMIAGQQVSGWMRHVKWSDSLHHVVFSLTRKTWFVMYKLYLAGIRVEADNHVSLLTDEELADYD